MYLAQRASRPCFAFTCGPSSARAGPRLSLHGSFASVRRALTAAGRRAEGAARLSHELDGPLERAGPISRDAGARHLVGPQPLPAGRCAVWECGRAVKTTGRGACDPARLLHGIGAARLPRAEGAPHLMRTVLRDPFKLEHGGPACPVNPCHCPLCRSAGRCGTKGLELLHRSGWDRGETSAIIEAYHLRGVFDASG